MIPEFTTPVVAVMPTKHKLSQAHAVRIVWLLINARRAALIISTGEMPSRDVHRHWMCCSGECHWLVHSLVFHLHWPSFLVANWFHVTWRPKKIKKNKNKIKKSKKEAKNGRLCGIWMGIVTHHTYFLLLGFSGGLPLTIL